MTTLALPPVSTSPRLRVASLGHTAVLLAAFLTMAIGGALTQHRIAGASTLPSPPSASGLYLFLIAMEWGLVLYVAKGIRRHGGSVRDLIGGRWTGIRDVARDAALALLAWGAWTVLSWGCDRLVGPDHAASVSSLLPRRPLDVALWVALSMSAGFAEELVFRGYLQTQFHALTGRRGVALVLQALVFGIAHGYQGVRSCLTISVYGLIMGALALSRRSLRPGMLAHAWTDVASGIFRI